MACSPRPFAWLAAACLGLPLVGCAAPAEGQHMNAKDAPCNSVAGTADKVACLQKEADAAEAERLRVFDTIVEYLPAEQKEPVRKAEQAWLAYREAMCAAERGLYMGGSGGPPAHLGCMAMLTRNHVKELRDGFWWQVEMRQ